jgi:hypothetical protein
MHAFGADDIFDLISSGHSLPGVDHFCRAQVVWFWEVLKPISTLTTRTGAERGEYVSFGR